MFNEKLFNDVKVVLFKNTIYEYDATYAIATNNYLNYYNETAI